MKPPEDYIKLDSLENYVVKKGDIIVTLCCGTMGSSWVSRHAGDTLENLEQGSGCEVKEVSRKGRVAPRFPTDKPYPFGY